MGMTEKEYEKVRAQYEQKMKNVSEADVKDAVSGGSEKIEELAAAIPKALTDLWEDIRIMVSLLKDYYSGDYKEVPWKVIASIVAAVGYFVLPLDVVPDIIPLVGYLDDAVVIKLAVDFAKEDLEDYRRWREKNKTDEK